MLVSINVNKILGCVFTNTQQPIEYGYDATPFFNTTGHACIAPQTLPCPNHWASRLNGTVAQRRVGTGIVLGDTLNYSTRAIYTQPHGSGWNAAQSVANMLAGLVGAFVGPSPATFDGKAHLLTNGQTIINTTAFQSAIQHQQQNTPSNNTPRAFIKALFFNEQLQLTDSALIRISRGANTVHTYSGQRTAQQNGYVYIYTTNEIVRFAHTNESNKQANGQSGIDVWFDDLLVSHRTGPLLQEAHFYPFGQEITPLSSKALLKTPNDRMLQQNEWDEEFGMNLHDFDARMYDASIGRFWGVDVYADKQYPLSPYHYAANNPVIMKDPNGEFFLAAALIVGKIALKKAAASKIAAGLMANLAKSKALKVSVSAAANMMGNRKQIGKAFKESGIRGIGMALGYGAVGAIGGAVGLKGTSLDAFITGGALNTMFEMKTGQMSGEGVNPLGRMAGSFLTGGFSALAGKNFAKSLEKGSDWAMKKYFGADVSLPNASPGIFSGKMMGKYAMSATENFGSILNKNDGHVNWKQFAIAWGGGFAISMGTYSMNRLLDDKVPDLLGRSNAGYEITSIASPLLSNALGATALNAVNYYITEGKWPKNVHALYKDWLKTFFKIDFYTGSSYWGFNLSDNGLAPLFR